MAGILSRFKTIMEANINALLDKAEDPVKMADQLARDLEKDLGEVRAETVSVMAEEKRAKRAYDEGVAEVEKLQRYAEKPFWLAMTLTQRFSCLKRQQRQRIWKA